MLFIKNVITSSSVNIMYMMQCSCGVVYIWNNSEQLKHTPVLQLTSVMLMIFSLGMHETIDLPPRVDSLLSEKRDTYWIYTVAIRTFKHPSPVPTRTHNTCDTRGKMWLEQQKRS